MSSFKNKQKYNQQNPPTSPIRTPRSAKRAANIPPPPPQRSISEQPSPGHEHAMRTGSNSFSHHPIKESPTQQIGDSRVRAASSGTAQNDFTKALKQVSRRRNIREIAHRISRFLLFNKF